jgi:hypothetical protein
MLGSINQETCARQRRLNNGPRHTQPFKEIGPMQNTFTTTRTSLRNTPPQRPFSPGDQVVRYVDGRPYFCTVIGIEADQKIRVSCLQWPAGYSALVAPQQLMWVAAAA